MRARDEEVTFIRQDGKHQEEPVGRNPKFLDSGLLAATGITRD